MQNEISHWDIHLRKSNHVGIIPTKLIQWSTYQNKFCATAFDQLGLYNRATQNRKFHEDLEHPLRKTMKDTFSLSLMTEYLISLSNFPLLFRIVSVLLSWIKTDDPWNERITNGNILWLEIESGGFLCQESQGI